MRHSWPILGPGDGATHHQDIGYIHIIQTLATKIKDFTARASEDDVAGALRAFETHFKLVQNIHCRPIISVEVGAH